MNGKTEQEVYRLADEALAHLHRYRDDRKPTGMADLQTVEKNLELIRRRTDPVA